jgi:hypothetical protein
MIRHVLARYREPSPWSRGEDGILARTGHVPRSPVQPVPPGLAAQIDLLPTLVELAGTKVPRTSSSTAVVSYRC